MLNKDEETKSVAVIQDSHNLLFGDQKQTGDACDS